MTVTLTTFGKNPNSEMLTGYWIILNPDGTEFSPNIQMKC